jgi:hypothetical protein
LRRVVIAGLSNWGLYANAFCDAENAPTGLGVLASLLAEVWDFDSDIVTDPSARIIPPKMLGKPIRAYYQGNALPGGAAAGSVLIRANNTRWSGYVERASGETPEIPPLPPERTNSNSDTTQDGHDTPSRSPPTPPAAGEGYTHHLIRDFMFLDAAANNQEAPDTPPSVAPRVAKQLSARFLPLNTADFTGEDSHLTEFTRGTGPQHVTNKHLLDTTTVAGSGNFAFLNDGRPGLTFTTLLYELVDLQNNPVDGSRAQLAPNWFGVAVPDGITDFTNVIIYFHPTPRQAGYRDPDYASKTNGGDPTHTYWKELLGYVDRLGSQLAGAVKHSQATPNQIVIVPLMRNDNIGNAGVLPQQWYYIVNDIIQDIPNRL